MRNQKKLLSILLGLAIMGGAWLPTKLVAHAEEVEVPGYCEYEETEGESIVRWYAIPRGTYLKDCICTIKDAGKAKVSVSATTTAHAVCDTVRASVFLDESSDGGESFGQIGSYYYSEKKSASCHVSKADISVTSGWYYMARGGHSVTKGSTTESSTTYTGALKAS